MLHRSRISRDQIKTLPLLWRRGREFRLQSTRKILLVVMVGLLGLVLASLGCASGPLGDGDRAEVRPTPESTSAHFDRPPLYRVDGGAGADLIMLGTIHIGPEKGWSLSPEASAALQEASTLILELDFRQMSEDAVSTLIANMVMLDPPQTLESVLRPETAKLLEEMDSIVTGMGMPPSVRKHMKPWFLAAGLIESSTASSAYRPAQGVESILMAELGDRPLIALETFEMQLNIFDDLPNDIQDIMLYDTLLGLDKAVEGIEELIQAWRTADERALERIAREGIDELPELELFYAHLLDKRNRNWVTQLTPLLEDAQRRDETILVGVGALHLVGSESVLSLMRKAGYSVSRIPQTKLKP